MQITISQWCKQHWRVYQDPEVARELIRDLRYGHIKVPQSVLRHLPESRFPRNEPGYVYVIEAVNEDGTRALFDDGTGKKRPWIKIGITKDPKSRLRELNEYEQRGLSSEFYLIAFVQTGIARQLEWYFHEIRDWLGLAIPGELSDMPAPLAAELLEALAGWMGYSFEPRLLAQCPSLRASRRVPWNAANRQH
ncbi:MAG: GIY-YIG nuclease family protein [Bryobacteraceae bacterium]